MKTLFHFDAGEALRQRALELAGGEIELLFCPESDPARLDAMLAEVEVWWHVLAPVTSAQLARAPKLRLVQKLGIGVNTIDLPAARARGVAVCNIPGANSRAVAEHALALMLAALRRLVTLDAATRRAGGWREGERMQALSGELGGRTVGLVGFGAVPRLLAPWLAAMGAEVIYSNRSARPDVPYRRVALDELLACADIVSLHLPLAESTGMLIDSAALARMKPGAILVNTARGGLVDQAALGAALRSGQLGCAALDVFASEPLAPDDALLAAPNVIVTPHVAWLTPQTLERCMLAALANCRRLIAGEPLADRVV